MIHSPASGGTVGGRALPHFGLSEKRGATAPALVDYILVAEFDIDSGSTVRHAYPCSVPGVSDDWFAEHMLPEGAHNHALDWTVMFLNRDRPGLDEDWPRRFEVGDPDNQAASSFSGGVNVAGDESYEPRIGGNGVSRERRGGEGNFLHCINLVRKENDPTVRRGAVVKAMCICSQYNYIEVFRPMLMIALEQFFHTQDADVLSSLFFALNSADIAGAPRPTPWERQLMRRGISEKHMGTIPQEHLTASWTHMLSFWYRERTVQTSVPIFLFPDETLSPSITLLVNLFGHNVMTIYNAVLTGRRVLFVGYNHAAGDVCKIVLAACALVSPPVQGILHRAFPYASLSDLSFLEIPSFVAGVTNPMFEAHPEWWDVLCQLDLPNGSGSVVTTVEMASESGGSASRGRASVSGSQGPGEDRQGQGNNRTGGGGGGRKDSPPALIYPGDSVLSTKLLAGVKAGRGESWARCECHDYTQGLVNLVLDEEGGLPEVLTSVSLDKLIQANAGRLRRLKAAAGLTARDADPWARCRGLGGGAAARGKGVQLRNFIRRLQLEKSFRDGSVAEGFALLSECLETEAELQVLLGLLPESKGGAGLLALGLLSTSPSARRSTVMLFRKLESFESTRPGVLCMNDFFKLALLRQAQELDNAPPTTPVGSSSGGSAGGVRGCRRPVQSGRDDG